MTSGTSGALDLKVEFEFALPEFGFSGVMLRSERGYRIELLHREGNHGGMRAGARSRRR